MRYTLVADGGADRALVHIINWALDQRSVTYTPQIPGWLDQSSLRGRCIEAAEKYPCDLLFVHRDAEGETLTHRAAEIEEALTDYDGRYVRVIPVRMTEAWLLSSEQAIRGAAWNPNGAIALDIPRWQRWDHLPDPKADLEHILRTATELSARRRQRFNVGRARHRVAELTTDYTALRQLAAFRSFEEQLDQALIDLEATGHKEPEATDIIRGFPASGASQ